MSPQILCLFRLYFLYSSTARAVSNFIALQGGRLTHKDCSDERRRLGEGEGGPGRVKNQWNAQQSSDVTVVNRKRIENEEREEEREKVYADSRTGKREQWLTSENAI